MDDLLFDCPVGSRTKNHSDMPARMAVPLGEPSAVDSPSTALHSSPWIDSTLTVDSGRHSTPVGNASTVQLSPEVAGIIDSHVDFSESTEPGTSGSGGSQLGTPEVNSSLQESAESSGMLSPSSSDQTSTPDQNSLSEQFSSPDQFSPESPPEAVDDNLHQRPVRNRRAPAWQQTGDFIVYYV